MSGNAGAVQKSFSYVRLSHTSLFFLIGYKQKTCSGSDLSTTSYFCTSSAILKLTFTSIQLHTPRNLQCPQYERPNVFWGYSLRKHYMLTCYISDLYHTLGIHQAFLGDKYTWSISLQKQRILGKDHQGTPARLHTESNHISWRRHISTIMHWVCSKALGTYDLLSWGLLMLNCSCLLRHTPGLFQKGTFCIDEETDLVFAIMPMVHAMHTSLCVSACACACASICTCVLNYPPTYAGIIHLYISIYVYKTIVYPPSFRMKALEKTINLNDWTFQHVSQPVTQIQVKQL